MRRILTTLVLLLAVAPMARAETTGAMLDSLERTAFQFFWTEANPANGLIRDRSTPGSPCSIASVGFGLSAICVGVDHGWVSRPAAASRVLTTLQTFWNGPQSSAASGTIGYQGFFYHFLDMNTATRSGTTELSSIDTALLLAGILDAGRYFDAVDPTEDQIRILADQIYRRVNWKFMQNFNPGILMGWKPGTGFSGFGQWIGYNEAMILYILALGSPTHAVAPSAWSAWTSGYIWHTQYGYSYVRFPPLFGHQYSHCWIDFRGKQDAYMMGTGIDYFENSRRATLAQRAYCIANPGGFTGYSDVLWGLTAGDGPYGYAARGAPPPEGDNGTITPTAAIGSIPFAPEVVIPTIANLYDNYKASLWGPYGFRDGFNLTLGWWATDVIGIDQGPIILMIENYATQSVWNRFMQSPEIQLGLDRAGFVQTTDVPRPAPGAGRLELYRSEPNPFSSATTIRFRLAQPGHVRLTVYDVAGREIARLVDGELSAGLHQATLRGAGLPSGVYRYRIEYGGTSAWKPCVLLR